MRLADQVCSLELALKLKELGVKQESLFYWHKEGGVYRVYRFGMIAENYADLQRDDYAAFTVAELGELLPYHSIPRKRKRCVPTWYCDGIGATTEADARAKMLIHLIERKLVTP